jgi:hypothetical protein
MRLLTLDNDEIVSWLEKLDKEARALKHEALKYSWYMRGGITYEDAMMLSYEERKMIADIVEDNIDTTKKTGLPFF